MATTFVTADDGVAFGALIPFYQENFELFRKGAERSFICEPNTELFTPSY